MRYTHSLKEVVRDTRMFDLVFNVTSLDVAISKSPWASSMNMVQKAMSLSSVQAVQNIAYYLCVYRTYRWEK